MEGYEFSFLELRVASPRRFLRISFRRFSIDKASVLKPSTGEVVS
jgi:hypothetical protein